MEKGFNGYKMKNPYKIVISGPESTGKTNLSIALAKHYNTIWIPEYARNYISGLKRPYQYDDLVHIARQQVEEIQNIPEGTSKIIFFDTWLIITRIWFIEVFKKYPSWLDAEILRNKPDLFLLCLYDLPWQYDPLRENGSTERRSYLFEQYKTEIEKIGCNYQIISGFNEERLNLAIQNIEQFIKNNVKK